jgi:hypothetical protein
LHCFAVLCIALHCLALLCLALLCLACLCIALYCFTLLGPDRESESMKPFLQCRTPPALSEFAPTHRRSRQGSQHYLSIACRFTNNTVARAYATPLLHVGLPTLRHSCSKHVCRF